MTPVQTIGFLIGCLLSVLFSCGTCEARTPDDRNGKLLETLQKISEQTNKSCPMAFDATTSLKGTTVIAPRTLRFLVTVPDSTQAETLRRGAVPLLRTMVADTPGMKPLRDGGTIFSFWFETQGNGHLFDFEVTPEDYRKRAKKRR